MIRDELVRSPKPLQGDDLLREAPFLNMLVLHGHCPIGRVENSKTFQNQMCQCFFIGSYDIENGDDFYFFQTFFLMDGY